MIDQPTMNVKQLPMHSQIVCWVIFVRWVQYGTVCPHKSSLLASVGFLLQAVGIFVLKILIHTCFILCFPTFFLFCITVATCEMLALLIWREEQQQNTEFKWIFVVLILMNMLIASFTNQKSTSCLIDDPEEADFDNSCCC